MLMCKRRSSVLHFSVLAEQEPIELLIDADKPEQELMNECHVQFSEVTPQTGRPMEQRAERERVRVLEV